MKDDKINDILENHAKRRRTFLTNSAKLAVAAPAVSLLLAGGMKSAMAQPAYRQEVTRTPCISYSCTF